MQINLMCEELRGGYIKFEDDSQTFTVPAVDGSVDIQKAVSVPTGYRFVGVINAYSNTGRLAIMNFVYNATNAYLSITNVSNTSNVGQTKTAYWTNVFLKN